jgi:uncharacterized membrane protein (UPF0136 family)
MTGIAQTVLGLYGLLLIVGGIMGKVRSGSTISLVTGGVFGIAALYAAWLSIENPAQGLLIGAMLALLLTGVFLSRLLRTRKWVPTGVLLLLSLAVGVLLVAARAGLHIPM